MRMEFGGTRVDYETAKARALQCLHDYEPLPAAIVADSIWPDHQMKAQGAGGAASRILKKMREEGLARWTVVGKSQWGWIKIEKNILCNNSGE